MSNPPESYTLEQQVTYWRELYEIAIAEFRILKAEAQPDPLLARLEAMLRAIEQGLPEKSRGWPDLERRDDAAALRRVIAMLKEEPK